MSPEIYTFSASHINNNIRSMHNIMHACPYDSDSELRPVNYLSNREYESQASATDLCSLAIRSDFHDLRPLERVVVRSSDG